MAKLRWKRCSELASQMPKPVPPDFESESWQNDDDDRDGISFGDEMGTACDGFH